MKHLMRSLVYMAAIFCACIVSSCEEGEDDRTETTSDRLGELYAEEQIRNSEWEYRDHEGGVYHYFKFETISETKRFFRYQEYYFEQGSRPQYEVKVGGTWGIINGDYMVIDIMSISCTNDAYLPSESSFPHRVEFGGRDNKFALYYNKNWYEKIE